MAVWGFVPAYTAGFYGGNPTQRARREAVEMQPIPAFLQLWEVTEEELRAYDGSDPEKPLLVAIKGQIYDVTRSRMFYGPGGPYALLAGRDASRALAKMSLDEQDLNANLEGLGLFELDALQKWESIFQCRYVKVGTIKKSSNREVEVTGAEGSNDAASEKATTDNHEKVESIEEVKENKVEVTGAEGSNDAASEKATTDNHEKVESIEEVKENKVEVTGAERSNDAASEKATTNNHEKVESMEEVKENKVGTDDLKHSKEGDVQNTEAY